MNIRAISAACAVLVTLSGCMTYDPYTDDKQVSKATTGAAIGATVAAIGAAIANRDDDSRSRNQRVLAAAAAGGAIGGGVGYYMDRQEAKLRAQLRNTGVSVIRDGDNLILVMPSNITFATGSFSLMPAFSDNLNLSDRRARAVTSALQAQGISLNRMIATGYGESRPVADNGTAQGQAQNRRVELVLVPITN
jgi:outer membrane protein OmpA-like peptidoglycan-associated protein